MGKPVLPRSQQTHTGGRGLSTADSVRFLPMHPNSSWTPSYKRNILGHSVNPKEMNEKKHECSPTCPLVRT